MTSNNINNNTSNEEVLFADKNNATGEINVQDAHKTFGVTKALNGCSFKASFGEIHAIVGPNGCG